LSKERVQKYRQKLKENGSRQINLIVSDEVYKKLKREQLKTEKTLNVLINECLIRDNVMGRKDNAFWYKYKKYLENVTSNGGSVESVF